jgi:integrase
MAREWGTKDEWSERFNKHLGKDFRTAAEKYLAEFDGKDPKRWAYAAESLLPYIGNLRLIDIDDDALTTWKNDRFRGQGAFTKPAMAGTLNKEIGFLVAVMNRACRRWRWIPSIPLFSRVKGPSKEPYPITWDEQSAWFQQLPTGWDVGAMVFAINTGARQQEVFGLKWSDRVMIPEHNTFVFILQRTKNGKDRPLILNSIARRCVENMRKGRKMLRRERLRILSEVEAGKYANSPSHRRRVLGRAETIQKILKSPYVFPSRTGKRMTGIARIVAKAWVAAGLPDKKLVKKGMHTTRHTFLGRLRAAGVSAEDRDSLSGHANKSLSQHYALPDVLRLQELAERVVERRDATVLRVVRSVT